MKIVLDTVQLERAHEAGTELEKVFMVEIAGALENMATLCRDEATNPHLSGEEQEEEREAAGRLEVAAQTIRWAMERFWTAPGARKEALNA